MTKRAADLTDLQRLCWRHIALHVAKTGKFPSTKMLSFLLGRSLTNAAVLRTSLLRKGYLAKTGTNAVTAWRILIWPTGIAPREVTAPVESCPGKPGNPTPAEAERMLRLKNEGGMPVAAIARVTGYSIYRVEIALGIRRRESKPVYEAPPKRRPCMMCGCTFLSEGPHNRVCQTCKGTSRWRGGNDLSFDGPRAGRGM